MKQVNESPVVPREMNAAATTLMLLLADFGFRINRMLPKDGSEVMTGIVKQPFATGSLTIPTGHGAVMADELRLTGSEEVVLEGDAVLVIV